jgi:hypothetical protein
MTSGFGIIVGCDFKQEWLLPWWWRHYHSHNDYPVFFVDFGMSKEGRKWCKKKGILIELPAQSISLKKEIPKTKRKFWENRYGAGIWNVRSAWLKKPFALLQYPLEYGLWLDLDCQVKRDLEPIFHSLSLGFEIAVVKDREQNSGFMLPNEISYSSGVIAFHKGLFLQKWVDTTIGWKDHLPGDQEILSRAIFLHEPALLELPPSFNWFFPWGTNDKAYIYHFCGGLGKIAILKGLWPADHDDTLAVPQPTDQEGRFMLIQPQS